MNVFESLQTYLPNIYKCTENSDKALRIIADTLQPIADLIELIPTYIYIDTAPEEWLELLGSNVGRDRREGEDLEIYRAIVKIRYYNTFVVPTHENLLRITKNVTGFYPFLKPLWEFDNADFPSQAPGNQTDLGYYLSYDLDPTFPTIILDEIEAFYPAGVKLIRDYLYRLEQNDLLVATIMYNSDTISIATVYGFLTDKIQEIQQNDLLQANKQYNDDIVNIGFKEEVI